MTKSTKIKLVRLRGRNQITLPASVIDSLSLEEGDYLAAVMSEDGIIRLRPAKMVTAGTPEAEKAMSRAEADLATGRSVQFDSVEEFTHETLAKHQEQVSETEARRTTMLVHVGSVSTSASIQRDGEPIFTRSISLGSKSATIRQIVAEVRKTVDFFQASGGAKIGTVFLSVGPPQMTGLADELKSELGVRVQELSAAVPVAPVGRSAKIANLNKSINMQRTFFLDRLTNSK